MPDDPQEHQPPRVLVWLMAAFFAVMSVAALAFWTASAVSPNGIRGVIVAIGAGTMTIFGTFHILAAISGVLLWQWERRKLPPLLRVALEASTVYFMLAVLSSIFFNYLAASLLDQIL